MTNAFACGSWEELTNTVEIHAAPENIDVCLQRFQGRVIRLESLEGEVYLKSGEGGTMGDPYIVSLFRCTFSRPAMQWLWRLREIDPQSKELIAHWRDFRVDVGTNL